MHRLSDGVLGHLGDVLGEAALAEEPTDEATVGSDSPLVHVADRFEIIGSLGRGGMGEVYRARDLELGKDVALKVQHVGDPWLDARFEREVSALAEIRHPCLVAHLAHGRSVEGVLWLATELLVGETLAERLRTGPLAAAVALRVARDVAAALGALHARGFVHRDVKPANIFVCDDGNAKLLDLGLLGAEKSSLVPSGASLTEGGALLGSVGYLSPEQARGARNVGSSADFFALGCVLFESLVGAPPFGRTLAQTTAAFAMAAAPPLARLPGSLPPEAVALCDQLLQITPERRPQTAIAIEQCLTGLLQQAVVGEPIDEETSPLERRVPTVTFDAVPTGGSALPFGPARPAKLAPAIAEPPPPVFTRTAFVPAMVVSTPEPGAPLHAVPVAAAPERVDLLWFDASSLPGLRATGLIRDESREDARAALVAALTGEPVGAAELRDSYLARGPRAGALLRVAGRLEVAFDPRDRLRAMLAAVRPRITSDAELERHYGAALRAIAAGDTLAAGVADALLDGLTRRLSALGPEAHDAIEKLVTRGLIESRGLLRRKLVAGAPVCATLRIPAENQSFVACLSDGAADQLPLIPAFRARLIVEPRAADDADQSVALRVVALGRVVERLR